MPYEPLVRIGSFLAVLLIMAWAEHARPKRVPRPPRKGRWFANLGTAFLSTGIVRLLFPVLPAALAALCAQYGWGLFNLLDLPLPISVPATMLLQDMAVYWQHVAFHRFLPLWRIHRMHHADLHIDASTGVRFHPLEIILSMVYKLTLVAILGPPVLGVILFEIVLNGCALFNHANLALPAGVDRILRLAVVTPDMHRVHHSTDMHEANRNFGFNFPWWDRLFSTYKPQPDLGHHDMAIGLNIFRSPSSQTLGGMLSIPFL